MESLKVKLNGTVPLLMDNVQAVDPENPIVKELSFLDTLHHTKKTDETRREADRLRWHLAVYTNEEGRLILPAANFEACLIEAGKVYSKGPSVKRGVSVKGDSVLKFKGDNKDLETLENDPAYAFRSAVTRDQGKKVMSRRPMFPAVWEAEYEVVYVPEVIGFDLLDRIINTAGHVGVGSWHERFGKFDVKF